MRRRKMTTEIFKTRWYLARYQQVNGRWETQVAPDKSWEAKWMAIDAAKKRGEGFTPFRGEFLMQQKNLVFVAETGDVCLPKESEAAA